MPFVARLPVNYAWVYALVLALPILANLSSASAAKFPRFLRLPAALPLRSWGERLGFAAFLFVLTTHWFAMLEAGGQRGRTLDAPGDSGEHRRQPRR